MKQTSLNKHTSLQKQTLLALLLSTGLLFIFSLPHVMALRSLLLVAAFLVCVRAFWRTLRAKQSTLVFVTMVYALLQIWMLVVALFIADQPTLSLLEWERQWLTTTLSLIIGMGLAAMLMRAHPRQPLTVIALTVAVPVAILVVVNNTVVLYAMIRQGAFITHHPGITDHTANIGYAIALLAPLLIADILSRIVKHTRLLPLTVWGSSLAWLMVVFALVTATSRNGLLTLLLVIILGGGVILYELGKIYTLKRIAAVFLMVITLIAGYVGIAFETDPRWHNFLETVPIAWNIDRDTLWLNYDQQNMPLTPSGKVVEASAYYRIAWAHEAWRMLLAHPWGTEISRNTFHDLVLTKYGNAQMSHSHNGWLDFGLNFGFPGLLLWAAFFFLLARRGWRTWKKHREPLGLALTLLVILFTFRALLDSIFRDHMVEQFMLVAGLLLGALTFRKQQAREHEQN